MCCKWKKIIHTLRTEGSSAIDIKDIKDKLDKEKIFDIEIIDELYIGKVFSREDYLYYLEKLTNNYYDNARYLGIILEAAKNNEDYNPLCHYCCCNCDN